MTFNLMKMVAVYKESGLVCFLLFWKVEEIEKLKNILDTMKRKSLEIRKFNSFVRYVTVSYVT